MDKDSEKSGTGLALPAFDIQLRRESDGVTRLYDPLRRKWLVATPEEWVRQHFVNYLVSHLGFPASFIANETGIKFNGMQLRCDTVIYNRNLRPLCIVEYKRPAVAVTPAVFDQIARYNSVLEAPFLIVSNGMSHYCCCFRDGGYEFLHSIPSYEEMCVTFDEKKR